MCVCVCVCTGIHAKYQLFLSDFNKTFRMRLNIKFHKSLPVRDELFHADGLDMAKLTVAFRSFAKPPKSNARYTENKKGGNVIRYCYYLYIYIYI